MENQGTLHTSVNGLNTTTQSMYPVTNSTIQPIAQSIVQDVNNAPVIQEMQEEISLWIARVIAYFGLTLLLYLNLEFKIPLIALFVLPVALDVFFIAYYLRKYFSDKPESHEKYYCLLEAVQSLMTLLFKISLYTRVSFGSWSYSWSCFILLAALIVRIVLINSFADEFNTPSSLVKTVGRIFGFALIYSVLFKIDGMSSMSWTGTFWSYWALFSIMVLMSLAVTLMSCGSGCSMISGAISINEFVVSLWLFFSVIGFTMVSFAFVINIIAYLEGNFRALNQALSLVLFYLPAFVIFTLFVFHRIPVWYLVLTKPIDPEELRLSGRRRPQAEERPPDPKEVRKEQLRAMGPQHMPNFLMRLSGSYFKKIDDFARWVFGRNRAGASGKNDKPNLDPKTLPESELRRGYVSFRNEGPNDKPSPDIKLAEVSINRQIKTERVQGSDSQRDSARYIKKTDRGNKGQQTAREGCTICLNAEANAVLMDCGHGAICFECGLTLLNTTCECHLCRRPVIQVLKIDTNFVHDDLLKVVEAADLHNIIKYTTQHTQDNSLRTANEQ